MPLNENEIAGIKLLLREELRSQLTIFRDEVFKRFDDITTLLDGLFQRDERREEEYLLLREQVRRVEDKVA